MKFGIIGSGSWATALAKILTDTRHQINWWIRNEESIDTIKKRNHNPHYLRSVEFDTSLLEMSSDIKTVVRNSEAVVFAIPSAYAEDIMKPLTAEDMAGKKVVSAIKGLMPGRDSLLNFYLEEKFGLTIDNYYAVLGPCHAEEVAQEKLSYLTFSGTDLKSTSEIAQHFTNDYVNTVVNQDILGVQYASVLKNIYALGAGIAHGLDYGDNFLSVYIANAADEMAGFLRKAGAMHIVVGEHAEGEDPFTHRKTPNYAASVYLGDLLVTCYSLHSRNRTFGNMIGKGYTVQSAQLELNMVAEGYNASKCIYNINKQTGADMPIAEMIYRILWENVKAARGFREIESKLV